MSDVERKDEQPEIEGHLQGDEERRPHLAPEGESDRSGHRRNAKPLSEDEGPEVEGHLRYFNPDRAASPERNK
jgi:hypothetical protein